MSDDDWVCHACKKSIEDRSIKAIGNRYHNECFACVRCKENFLETGNKNITTDLGRLYCAICAIAKADDPEPNYVDIKDGHIINCSTCGSVVDGKFSSIGDEKSGTLILCNKCVNATPTCKKCNKEILKNKYFHPPVGHFHQECFVCNRCGADAGGDLHGELLCGNCHNDEFSDPCEICHKKIKDESKMVHALRKKFHSWCFACSVCDADLTDTMRKLEGGKLFCKKHFPK
eukprot:TRINITY_DN1629_c0_g1_i1.p1 TRINITY_DN1629_c0_g1~~TRINITY_DN1629_c0_g1_i1.p1  ORF type:complete len:243 (-),score=44.34 TRINITY_DN1629_c0_g1_i1:77-769(-)